MSYEDGMAALRLEMPKRVPRTELSAETYHWELISRVIGRGVDENATDDMKTQASSDFVSAWNYDFFWWTSIYTQALGDIRTDMGHASYASDGSDYQTGNICPFKMPQDVFDFDPWKVYGRIDMRKAIADFEASYDSRVKQYPDLVNVDGIYISCVSGLIAILGWDMLLLAAGTDPVKFGEFTNRYASWIQQYFDALAATKIPVVMIHDDIVWTSGPFIAPDWYRQYIFPNYKKYFAPLKDAGKIIMYTSDGDYTMFFDDVVDAGANCFVMEPCCDMKLFAEKYGRTHGFIGNADTRILLDGTKQQIRQEVQRCMDIGKGCPGFFMLVSNHIPANTPVESAIYYNQVYEELSVR